MFGNIELDANVGCMTAGRARQDDPICSYLYGCVLARRCGPRFEDQNLLQREVACLYDDRAKRCHRVQDLFG